MLFLVYTRLNADTRPLCSGLLEAHHYDTFLAMKPLLEHLGEVRQVSNPEADVDALYREAHENQRRCLFLSFTLPHRVPLGLTCPTVAVFDWAYDTVPDHEWQQEPRNDWPAVMSQINGIITGSHFSASVLRSAASQRGLSLPIAVVPVRPPARASTLNSGIAEAHQVKARPEWLDTHTAQLDQLSPALFEKSQQLAAAIPRPSSRASSLVARLRRVWPWSPRARRMAAARPTPAASSSYESRSANLAPLSSLQAWRERQLQPWLLPEPPRHLGGIIYTATQNPLDHHNLYHDLITAFCEAFREQKDATLVLHLEHRDGKSALQPFLEELYRLHPFQCRILICIGEPDEAWWTYLAGVSHFHIHISRGDGSCPRLLQMMEAGKPAITSQATAMGDVARPVNSFIVEGSREPTWWPHDERGLLRASHIRLNWSSLYQAFVDSHKVATRQPDLYRQMAASAQRAAEALTNEQRSIEQLEQMTDHIFLLLSRAPETSESPGSDKDTSERPDPRMVGLRDIVENGWFNRATGELCAGFDISGDSKVLDFGCGVGHATLFCAQFGAHVTFTDTDLPKLETLVGKVKQTIAQSWRGFLSENLPLPMADASVNRVICMEVLEHIENPQEILDELVRVGEPGALYLLTVPEARAERLQQQLSPPEHFEAPNHIHIFDRATFSSMVTNAGLSIESSQSMSFYWALWFGFYWASQLPDEHNSEMPTLDQIQPPYADVLTNWAETWQLVMDHDKDGKVRHALDQFMPKSQVIIARKP